MSLAVSNLNVTCRRLRHRDHLLVLDIGIPAEVDDLWSAIFHEWAAYLGYVTPATGTS